MIKFYKKGLTNPFLCYIIGLSNEGENMSKFLISDIFKAEIYTSDLSECIGTAFSTTSLANLLCEDDDSYKCNDNDNNNNKIIKTICTHCGASLPLNKIQNGLCQCEYCKCFEYVW